MLQYAPKRNEIKLFHWQVVQILIASGLVNTVEINTKTIFTSYIYKICRTRTKIQYSLLLTIA